MPNVDEIEVIVKSNKTLQKLTRWGQLLRWNKPSGRLILLIPAGWALWLTPTAPPEKSLFLSIIIGGLCVSAAGCIANDLWDRKIDRQVARTINRPLAKRTVRLSTAFGLLALMLLISFLVVLSLPTLNRGLCLILAFLALPPILIYPSAKRWFPYPQAFLAICWGFAVLIPWAASEASLTGNWSLIGCWAATLIWTFGFDTVYAMADRNDDMKLGLNSSAINLGRNAKNAVAISYLISCLFLAIAAFSAGVKLIFWPILIIASIGMQKEVQGLNQENLSPSKFGEHFQHQVWLGGLILLGLILGR